MKLPKLKNKIRKPSSRLQRAKIASRDFLRRQQSSSLALARLLNRLSVFANEDVLGLNGGDDRYYVKFNGTDSYIDLNTGWTPSGSFEVEFTFSEESIAPGEAFISGTSSNEDCIIVDMLGASLRAFAYVGTSVTGIASLPLSSLSSVNNIKIAFDDATDTATITANDNLTDSATWVLNGSQGIKYLATRAASGSFFDGTMYDVYLTDLTDSSNSRFYAINPSTSDLPNITESLNGVTATAVNVDTDDLYQ